MSEVENNIVSSDPFDFFVDMMNEDTKGLSQTTRDALASEKQMNQSGREAPIEYDAPDAPEDYDTPDWSFLEEGDPVFEDEESNDDNGDSSDEEENTAFDDEQEESPEVENTDDTDYGDTVDIDLDTIITIHGKEYTAEELVNRYQEDEIFNQRKAEFEAERNAFIEDKEASVKLLDLTYLECDRQLAEYQNGFDWEWLAANDPRSYIENKQYVERLQHKKQEVIQEQQRLEAEKQAQEDAAFRAKSRACVQVLESEIKGWNENLYSNLMQHAIDYYGADEADVLKWNNPSIFKMLNDAYRAHNDILKAKASIKRTKVNGRFVRPGTNAMHQTNAQAKRDQIAKDYAQGKVSQELAFSFLED